MVRDVALRLVIAMLEVSHSRVQDATMHSEVAVHTSPAAVCSDCTVET